MITLYDCSTAPSPRRTRILLAEKGVAHDTVEIDLRRGEQLGDAFRAINPQCTVPVLRTDDGLLLTDNAAITAWLEARFPEPPVLGVTPAEKAEIASWTWRVECEGLLAIAEAMRNSAPALAERALAGPVNYAQIPELAQRGQARARQFFATLERAPRRPRLPCRRPVQRRRHHGGGRGRLRPRHQAPDRRAGPRAAALARRDGAAARHDALVVNGRRARGDL